MKRKVFVITPFDEDFLALFTELTGAFEEDFEFNNAGDLDNQQNILQDIVEGIYQADVIIADLTGLNANVFYELGLAHAMNKKVIIITRDIGELPFDIKSYRAHEYSLQFNKLPKLISELKKLLYGAIDNSVKYGNPVSDYIPDYFKSDNIGNKTYFNSNQVESNSEAVNQIDDDGERGFIDYIADITDNSRKMTDEIESIGTDMDQMNASISSTNKEMNRVKSQSGSVDAVYFRNEVRKLASPIGDFAGKLNGHVSKVSTYWEIIENSYLSLLDSPYTHNPNNTDSLKESVSGLTELQEAIDNSNNNITGFIDILHSSLGMERRLNKAISSLIRELEEYIEMTITISSSVDRIKTKCKIVIGELS